MNSMTAMKIKKGDNVSTDNTLHLYFIAHLNLLYSSINEEDHGLVIEKCYWPLLELCESNGFPAGIELSAYTLERINEIDGSWIEKLKDLCRKGICELIGAGYSQLIGPLVPQRVNEKNLEIGLQVYDEILGVHPKIAYVNEQAYSAGMVDVYIKMGFGAIFMEWNNVYSANKDSWNPEWQFYPQYAVSAAGNKIPVLWNNAVSFQRLQRFIHGEVSRAEYSRYLESNIGTGERYFCMYGNDVEIFDFRPGRYHAEAELEEGEWPRFAAFVQNAKELGMYSFILPSDVLSVQNQNAYNELKLSTAASPVPVKKQSKYNITRWALSGRDDVRNNGSCYRLYDIIEELYDANGPASDESEEYWKELCYLWSSDFRTHITDRRYTDFIKRQGILEYRLRRSQESGVRSQELPAVLHPSSCTVLRDGHYITVETPAVKISVNSRRGMAIDSLIFKEIDEIPVIRTLHQGYFNDMSWGVDLYSGHMIVQPLKQSKITDLVKVDVADTSTCGNGSGPLGVKTISCGVKTLSGTIYKKIHVFLSEPKIELEYIFEWNGLKDVSLHAGIITFNPEAFEEETLYYATHNGGPEEKYYLKGHDFNHARPVSQSVISAEHCLGATTGTVRVGDKNKSLIIRADRYPVSARPMIEYHRVDDKFLLRLYHSLGEHDETSYWMWKGRARWRMSVEFANSEVIKSES